MLCAFTGPLVLWSVVVQPGLCWTWLKTPKDRFSRDRTHIESPQCRNEYTSIFFSDFLKKELDEYVAKHFNNVKVIHADKREGLIRTRILGARHATGEVILFLDSHVEANINYLPPLLGNVENYG